MDKIVAEISGAIQVERDLLKSRQQTARSLRIWLSGLIGVALLAATMLAVLLAVAKRQAVKGLLDRTIELETESKLRHEAEATLRRVQKIEAVGTAHRRHRSRLKAAQLTHRLLAFSRRQALEPARLDVNRLIAGMLEMLQRTLAEQISIETVLGAGLWPVFADAHQLENALLNLALNARAAMPDGGCLTIETANTYLDEGYARQFGDVTPGQYVVLCVTDTGTGIPRDILDRVFEPFVTTKGAGEGTGLGLAMVHGFVKQSGGHLRIYSEEGHGTTVKIYLPRLTQAEDVKAAPAAKLSDTTHTPRARPNETVLLVEDNEGVRDYAKGMLEGLGYRVLEAGDAGEALRLLTKSPGIDLLFTDVVLPGAVTGRVLADKAREIVPDLPVLYTTGYTRNAIVHQGRLDADVKLLNKPYAEQDLARKVREVIDASQRSTSAAASS